MAVKPSNLYFVDDLESANALMRWVGERRPLLGCDTETEGLDLFSGDRLRLVQVGDSVTGWAISATRWLGLIEHLMRAVKDSRKPVVFANAKFDIHALELAGVPVPDWRHIHDTVIMARLVASNRRAGLKEVGERYFPGSSAGEEALKALWKRTKTNWRTVPENALEYWVYAAWDPVLAVRIAEEMWAEVQLYRAAYEREMAVMAVLHRAESRGMRVDPGYTARLLQEWEDEESILRAELKDIGLGNPQANRQVAEAMKATEHWSPAEFTPTGEPKLTAEVMKGIDSEISRRVLRLRRITKWSAVYLRNFLSKRDANDCVHASINTMQARTGRMSITGIPLQTLPSEDGTIRNCLLPYEGDVLWASDFNNMEMRVFAHFSQDPALLHAARTGLDFHAFTAGIVFGIPIESVAEAQRKLAKQSVSFGKLFGAGEDKIAMASGATIEQVREFSRVYDAKFPGVEPFMQRTIGEARKRMMEDGRPFTETWGGRRAYVDNDRLYAAVNYKIQGTAGDIFKDGLIRLAACGFEDNIVLPVHDEVIFSFPEGDTDGPIEAALALASPNSLSVPLTTGLKGPLERWGDAYAD